MPVAVAVVGSLRLLSIIGPRQIMLNIGWHCVGCLLGVRDEGSVKKKPPPSMQPTNHGPPLLHTLMGGGGGCDSKKLLRCCRVERHQNDPMGQGHENPTPSAPFFSTNVFFHNRF